MTSPGGNKLTITVVGDVRDLARDMTRDINKSLRSVKLDTGSIENQLEKIGEAGSNAFRELGRDGDRILGELARDADKASESISSDLRTAGEQAERALGEVGDRGEREMDRIEREARDAGGGMLRNLSLAAVGIGAAFAAIQVGQFFLDAAQQAEDLGSAIANTTQVIKSTGAAAGLTAQQVRALSRELSLKIGVDSVEVQNAANVLLTFKGVAGDTFERAIGLAADLSAVLGTDLKGSTLQLGKALQDPIRGITALRRAGVDFTESQREQIANFVETGNVAKAQALILDEVARQVGGVAEAGVDTTDQLKVAFLDLKRVAGTALIGFIDDHGPRLIALIQTMEPVVATIGEILAAAFSAALPFVELLATSIRDNFAAIGPAIQPAADVFSALLDILPGVIPPLVEITKELFPPLVRIVRDVASAVGPLIALVIRLAAQFVRALIPALDPLADGLGDIAQVLGGALMDALPEVAEAGLDLLGALLPLVPLAVELLRAVLPLVPPFIDLAAAIASLGIEAIAGPLAALTGLLADNEGVVLAVVAAIVAMSVASKANAVAVGIMTAAMKVSTAVQGGFKKGMAGIASAASNASLGLAAAGVAILAWGEQARHTSDDVTGLTEDIKRFVETGATTATLRKHFGEGADAIAEFDDKLDLASAGFFNFADHLNRTFDEISKGKSAFVDLDTALADLVNQGADADVVFNRLVTTYNLSQEQIDQLRRVLPQYAQAAGRAKDRTDDLSGAQNDATKGTLAHVKGLKELGDALRAQTDPVFAFVRGQRAVRDAQKDVTDALKEYGRRSPQYRDAVLDLADAQLDLVDATGDVKGATDASLLPALKRMRDSGLISRDAFNELAGAIQASKDAAERLDGTQIRVRARLDIETLIKESGIGRTPQHRGIPFLHTGGLTTREGLANLHPSELVLPLEDRRAVDLLSKAMQDADASLRAARTPEPVGQGTPQFDVRVYIGDRELTDIVDVQISERDRTVRQRVRAGAGARR